MIHLVGRVGAGRAQAQREEPEPCLIERQSGHGAKAGKKAGEAQSEGEAAASVRLMG